MFAERDAKTAAASSVTLVTAYSVDYPPGHICAARNRHYAQLHGYGFRCWVDSNLAMCERIDRCSALTWCKVHAINDALREAPPDGLVLWIDADALVVRLDVRVEDVHAAHGAPELLVAKDVTPQCLINGGVLLIQNTAWARLLFADLWEGASAKGLAFLGRKFHEQSRLEALLKVEDPSLFKEATSREAWLEPGLRRGARAAVADGVELNTRELEPPPRFIFHACGKTPPGESKGDVLRRACAAHGGEALGSPPWGALSRLRPRAGMSEGCFGGSPLGDGGLAALVQEDGGGGGGGDGGGPPPAYWLPHLDVSDCCLTTAATRSMLAAVRSGVWSLRAAGNTLDIVALLGTSLRHLDASRCELRGAAAEAPGAAAEAPGAAAEAPGAAAEAPGVAAEAPGAASAEATGAASSPDAASLCALLRHCAATHIDLTSSLDAPTRLALLALLRDEARAEGHERQVSHPFMASGKSKPPVLVFWLRFEKSRPPGTSAVLLL